VALAGTAAQVDWFPIPVERVILALDGDEGGKEATHRLAEQFERAGIGVRICLSQQEEWGKDWNERWRRLGPDCMAPIHEEYERESVGAN
jgi:DNA primase